MNREELIADEHKFNHDLPECPVCMDLIHPEQHAEYCPVCGDYVHRRCMYLDDEGDVRCYNCKFEDLEPDDSDS